ncbi:MAG: acyl carrier protein [Nannocystaceae bacterium]
MTAAPEEPEILALIVRHLEANLEQRPPGPIVAETRIVEDLALDSLQSFEMIATVEDEYSVNLDIERLQDARTIGDLARIITAIVSERAS